MQKVSTVEPLAVSLDHGDPVLSPLEYLHLVHREDVGPGEVSLSSDVDLAVSILQSYSFSVISILQSCRKNIFVKHF